LSQLLCSSLTT